MRKNSSPVATVDERFAARLPDPSKKGKIDGKQHADLPDGAGRRRSRHGMLVATSPRAARRHLARAGQRREGAGQPRRQLSHLERPRARQLRGRRPGDPARFPQRLPPSRRRLQPLRRHDALCLERALPYRRRRRLPPARDDDPEYPVRDSRRVHSSGARAVDPGGRRIDAGPHVRLLRLGAGEGDHDAGGRHHLRHQQPAHRHGGPRRAGHSPHGGDRRDSGHQLGRDQREDPGGGLRCRGHDRRGLRRRRVGRARRRRGGRHVLRRHGRHRCQRLLLARGAGARR